MTLVPRLGIAMPLGTLASDVGGHPNEMQKVFQQLLHAFSKPELLAAAMVISMVYFPIS